MKTKNNCKFTHKIIIFSIILSANSYAQDFNIFTGIEQITPNNFYQQQDLEKVFSEFHLQENKETTWDDEDPKFAPKVYDIYSGKEKAATISMSNETEGYIQNVQIYTNKIKIRPSFLKIGTSHGEIEKKMGTLICEKGHLESRYSQNILCTEKSFGSDIVLIFPMPDNSFKCEYEDYDCERKYIKKSKQKLNKQKLISIIFTYESSSKDQTLNCSIFSQGNSRLAITLPGYNVSEKIEISPICKDTYETLLISNLVNIRKCLGQRTYEANMADNFDLEISWMLSKENDPVVRVSGDENTKACVSKDIINHFQKSNYNTNQVCLGKVYYTVEKTPEP